jgi:hypothetical protein
MPPGNEVPDEGSAPHAFPHFWTLNVSVRGLMFHGPSTGAPCPRALREPTSIAPSTAVQARIRSQKAGSAERDRVKKVTCAKMQRSRIRDGSSAHLQWVRKGWRGEDLGPDAKEGKTLELQWPADGAPVLRLPKWRERGGA